MNTKTPDFSGLQVSKTEKVARAGYGAKAILYGLLGGFAASSAFGGGGGTMGFKDVLQWIGSQSYGEVLLGILVVGLACYALYRLACAAFDLEQAGSDGKGIAKRIGFAGSGIVYAGLAFFAGQVIADSGSSSGGSKDALVATLMQSPVGKVALALVALGLFGAAISQLKKAWTGGYRQKFSMGELPNGTERFVRLSAKSGLTARAVVFTIIGGLLAWALFTVDPSKAGGTQEAFQWMSGSKPYLYGLVGLGFVAYAIYAGVIAYCGRFRSAEVAA
ncbi:MAG: DUF1206 domain-containing protein [Verrucomicrobiota bacterium JB023]|nr:DUF1206 domain-containing protein [Verrucomicrobiota bacterium JB023]